MPLPPHFLDSIYYDKGQRSYLIPNTKGDWIPVTEKALARHLAGMGISRSKKKEETISPAEILINSIQLEETVEFSGPLAGYKKGILEVADRRILVTESPVIIEPQPGPWETLQMVFKNLLRDKEYDQLVYFHGWIKCAYQALVGGVHRPGQALVFAGPHDCGKSLVQNIITLILGGKSAKPYSFMNRKTDFNKDMFGAVHLILEDENPSTDLRARRAFGSAIKNVTVNEDQRYHAKYCDALILRPLWRLSISMNEEPENLMVLPPIDNSLEDKLILLQAKPPPQPYPTKSLEERKDFWDRLVGELPAYIHWLTTDFEIPIEKRCKRFGVKYFHHPNLLSKIADLSPESLLLDMIDQHLFEFEIDKNEWKGTAMELEEELTDNIKPCAYKAKKLFSFNNACGVYLGRLKKKNSRIRLIRSSTKNSWGILPPE